MDLRSRTKKSCSSGRNQFLRDRTRLPRGKAGRGEGVRMRVPVSLCSSSSVRVPSASVHPSNCQSCQHLGLRSDGGRLVSSHLQQDSLAQSPQECAAPQAQWKTRCMPSSGCLFKAREATPPAGAPGPKARIAQVCAFFRKSLSGGRSVSPGPVCTHQGGPGIGLQEGNYLVYSVPGSG